MRLLIVNPSNRRIAGTEDYLSSVIPELHARGHQLAFAHEVDVPHDRQPIALPQGSPSWDLSKLGIEETLGAMRDWKPELIYAHGLLDTDFEAHFLKIAPAAYFAHNYYGTCISGLKTFQFPVVRPCNRRFGSACLLHYFPHRCGGANPVTMVHLYRRESRRLANLSAYDAIVTHSSHMREEYVRNGLPESRVHNFLGENDRAPISAEPDANPRRPLRRAWHLLFVGRMEALKGGAMLLEALPLVAERLGRPIRLVLAGDGPQRQDWGHKAAQLQASHPLLELEFTGWLGKSELGVALLDLRFSGYEGSFAGARAPTTFLPF